MNIFKLACEMASPFHTGKVGDSVWRRVELNIASTCSSWREIAMAQPELWRTICIPFMVPSLYSNRTTEDRETYLQRSHPESLDIWLTFVAEVPDDSILLVLDTLSIHSNRVRRLAVLFDGGAPKNLVVRQIVMGWNLERIESLELHVDPHDDDDESLEANFDPLGNFDQLKLLGSIL